jgi:hypothetical protein
MPQITVTLSDEAYWELMQIEKGLKSGFVNQAVMEAVRTCFYDPEVYRSYVREGVIGARERLKSIQDRPKFQRHPNQQQIGVEEE